MRGFEARAEMVDLMQRGDRASVAQQFDLWWSRRRITNPACTTLLGCYPIAIGLGYAWLAKKPRDEMIQAMLTGMTAEE